MNKLLMLLALSFGLKAAAQESRPYTVTATYHIASPGGWDYIALNKGKIYASHGTQVNILDEATGDSLGFIPNTNGVHGIAFNNKLGRGYTSNGRANEVSVFDLKTFSLIEKVATGQNPDAILFDPYTNTIITCNGRSNNLSIIDAATDSVKGTIALEGKPETAVSDGFGRLFVNIEDKNEIAVVDLAGKTLKQYWTLAGAEGPTGLAYDPSTGRLFSGCDKLLVVMSATDGKIIAKLPIGDGCDGVAFDPARNLVFTSNGSDGTITVIREKSAEQFMVLGNYPTKRGARTLTLDPATGAVFLPTADFETGASPNGRPKVIPGTFQVLVVRRSK